MPMRPANVPAQMGDKIRETAEGMPELQTAQLGPGEQAATAEGENEMNIEQINSDTIRIDGKLHKLTPIDEPLIDAEGRYLTEPGRAYWRITSEGEVFRNRWDADIIDRQHFIIGNMYATREAAERQSRKLAAIQRMRKWAAENAPFTPDWRDAEQFKYFVDGWHYMEERPFLGHSSNYGPNNGLPVFATAEARDRFIIENADDLKVWAGVE